MDTAARIIFTLIVGAEFVLIFGDEWKKLRSREREYDAFERRRVIRQRACDRHAKAVARRELIETWGNITVGRWQG